MGNLQTSAKDQRNQVENALSSLDLCLNYLLEIDLRTRQAMRRTNIVVGVLDPAIERIGVVQLHITNIKRFMSALWQDGQRRRWNDANPHDES